MLLFFSNVADKYRHFCTKRPSRLRVIPLGHKAVSFLWKPTFPWQWSKQRYDSSIVRRAIRIRVYLVTLLRCFFNINIAHICMLLAVWSLRLLEGRIIYAHAFELTFVSSTTEHVKLSTWRQSTMVYLASHVDIFSSLSWFQRIIHTPYSQKPYKNSEILSKDVAKHVPYACYY